MFVTGFAVTLASAVIALAIWQLIARGRWRPWVGFASSAFDVSMISIALASFFAVRSPLVARYHDLADPAFVADAGPYLPVDLATRDRLTGLYNRGHFDREHGHARGEEFVVLMPGTPPAAALLRARARAERTAAGAALFGSGTDPLTGAHTTACGHARRERLSLGSGRRRPRISTPAARLE